MSLTVTNTSFPSPSSLHKLLRFASHPKLVLHFHSLKSPNSFLFLRQASRRVSNSDDPRNWSRSINSEFSVDYEDDDGDDEEEEEDRSLDLFLSFVSNVFKKVSKRARKAVRSILPVPISSKLVEFAVNGVLLLAFFWVLKAFLEVVCTLGSMVFVSILLIRGVWSGVTYFQERLYLRTDEHDDDPHAWSGAQPMS